EADAPVLLDDARTDELLAAYGLTVWPVRTVTTDAEALAAATELGWPVTVRSAAPRLRRRLDLGTVRLDVAGPAALAEACAHVRHVVAARGETDDRLQLQCTAPAGVACVVRSSEDPRFGPVVAFGLAGDATDLLDDVAYAVAPLTDADVAEMVRTV